MIGSSTFLLTKSLEAFSFNFEVGLSFFLFPQSSFRNYSFMCRVGLLYFFSYQDPPLILLENDLIIFLFFPALEFSLLIFRLIPTIHNLESF
jgi:hypothetical protein